MTVMTTGLLLISTVLFSASAFAADVKNDTKITFDLQSRQIQFYGVYAPAGGSSRTLGLEAEIAARRNGIAHLSSFLATQCGNKTSEQAAEKMNPPVWQAVVKSLGSEIFANGVLKIALVAPMKDVLKDSAKKKGVRLKTNDGVPLALKFPKVTGRAVKCGLVSLNIGGRTVELNPLSVSSEAGAKIVNLTVDGVQLKPAGAAELALLENSNLVKSVDGAASSPSQTTPEKSSDAPATAPAAQKETSGQAN
ncbi:MAG: hypothetical protein EBR09_08755 [Proteobacteria bacterium]|nr:hypothetical protein [Pseudomonadota bacterium]